MNFFIKHILENPKNSLWAALLFLAMIGIHGLIYGFSTGTEFVSFYIGAALVSLFSSLISWSEDMYTNHSRPPRKRVISYIITVFVHSLLTYLVVSDFSLLGPFNSIYIFVFLSCLIWMTNVFLPNM